MTPDAAPGLGDDRASWSPCRRSTLPRFLVRMPSTDLGQLAGLGVVDPDDLVSSGSSESSSASAAGASTRMIPPGISWADRPWAARIAWKACGQGWFVISAVTSPLTSLPRMMVRPLKRGEAGDHVGDAGAVPGHGDAGLLPLRRGDRVGRGHPVGARRTPWREAYRRRRRRPTGSAARPRRRRPTTRPGTPRRRRSSPGPRPSSRCTL